MHILLTNDDGIQAPGLWALYDRFRPHFDVTVIAPDRERSAVGHAITLHQPLRSQSVALGGDRQGFAVNGTPADCVKLGLAEILERRPDLVVAGINPGANVGVNLSYSGTVAAAKEAALCGLSAMAVSMNGHNGLLYPEGARFALRLTRRILDRGLPRGTFLNVNMPNRPLEETAGVQVSRQGCLAGTERFERRLDPRNRPYYWSGIDLLRCDGTPEVDGTALNDNFITITPVKCDMTDYDFLEALKQWEWEPAGDSRVV
jgi:5'-nucleotidase